ncbi:hypothetical protein Tco_0355755 [Tanacetum coccineum]
MHNDDVHIPLIGSSKDTKFQEADFDLESMPDDEIEFVYGLEVNDDDDKDNHSKHKAKLSKTNEAIIDDVIDELVADKIDNSVPRMVVDDFEERLPELLSDTLKNILLNLLKDSVKKALPKFDKRVKKTLRVKVPKIILKPLNREFNALHKIESRRVPRDIMIINAKQLQTKVEKNAADIHELVELTKKIGEQESSDQVAHTSIALVIHLSEEPLVKKLKFVLDDIPIPSPTPLKSIRLTIIDNIPYEQFLENLFISSHSEFSPTPPPKMADKGKCKAQVSVDDQIKKIMPLMDEGGSAPSFSNLNQFKTVGEGPLTLKEAKLQI